jgi:hypothetical protein
MRAKKMGQELRLRGVIGVLEGVFGERLVGEAVKMEVEKDWRTLYCCLPYSMGIHKLISNRGLQGEKVEVWKDLGQVGRITVSEEAYLRCVSAYGKEVEEEDQWCEEELEVGIGGEGEEEQFEGEDGNEDEEPSNGLVHDESQGHPWDDVQEFPEAPNLDSYGHSVVLDDMFEWMLEKGFGRLTDLPPNTGAYVKWKNDGSKLQVISDRSERNKMDVIRPKSFKLFSPEDMKKLLRGGEDVRLFIFDISNFFHCFEIPEAMRDAVPTIYRWVQQDGSIWSVEAFRLVFGGSFSPVVSQAAISEFLRIQDTVFERRERVWRKDLWDEMVTDRTSGIYIDDFVEAGVGAEERFDQKMEMIMRAGCGIKPTSVQRGVLVAEYAGKGYCGNSKCPRIGNSDANKTKCMAMLLCCVRKGVSKEMVESLVGSISFLGSPVGWCFPFLRRCSEWVRGATNFSFQIILEDLVLAFVVACIPWCPMSEILWFCPVDFPQENHIFVDAQNDFGRFGMIWCKDGVWMERSVRIPKKFCCSQQCAELFAITKALGLGFSIFGREFAVVSDSVGSITALCRPNMATKSWRRNQILRRFVLDLVGREFLVWLLWVPSELNPSDDGSRMVVEERMVEREYKGDMVKVFEKGNLFDRTQFFSRARDRRSESEHADGILPESEPLSEVL